MTAKALTLTAAATEARALGYTIRRTEGGDVAAYRKGEGVNSPAAYFTGDVQDALDTVREMARRDALTAEAAAMTPAEARTAAEAAKQEAFGLIESDPLAAAFAYDRAAALTRRTVALYVGHGKRARVMEKAASYDSQAFSLRADYCKARAREAAELDAALAAAPEVDPMRPEMAWPVVTVTAQPVTLSGGVMDCGQDGESEAVAALRPRRAAARIESRVAGHECEDTADTLTGEARAAALDLAADHFDNVGGAHYPARARSLRKEAAAIRETLAANAAAARDSDDVSHLTGGEARAARVINLTPTWAGLAPALFLALTNGTPEGQQIAREELTRALAALDAHNAAAKAREMTEAQRAEVSARLDRATEGNLRAFAFATLAQGQDVPEAAEDNLPGFAQPVTATA